MIESIGAAIDIIMIEKMIAKMVILLPFEPFIDFLVYLYS